jgi:multidrug efflux system membrane fusion protein
LPRIQQRQQTQPLLATLDMRDRAGHILAAPVDFTSNIVSNQSGTIELRATFANTDLSLVPGQLVNVTVQLNDIPHALVVPRDAVNDSPSGSFVFVVRDGKAFQTLVEVLTDDGTNAAITGSGIAAGDTVVIEGQLRVTPGGAVRVLGAKGGAAGKAARHKP